MNITIHRDALSTIMRRMASISPTSSPLDLLKCVLLEAQDDTLTVTANSLELFLQECLPCTVRREGSVVLDARLLSEMLEQLPGDRVALAQDGKTVHLSSGRAGYRVAAQEPAGFPRPDHIEPVQSVTVRDIPALARRTVFAASREESKPLLKCVALRLTADGLAALGSDGSCLVSATADRESTGDAELLIPATSLGKLAKLVSSKDALEMSVENGTVIFRKPSFMFGARLIEGAYLNADRLVSSVKPAFTVLTDTRDLHNALSSVLTVEVGGKVGLVFEGNRLTCRCIGQYASAATPLDVIPLTGTPTGEFWYASDKLERCTRALTGTATLGVAPGGMLMLSTDDALYLQSPMRAAAEQAPKRRKAA